MRNVVVVLPLTVLAACPAPSVDSVDGLGGGALSSPVTAPAMNTTTLTTESLDASAEVTAASVTAGVVTSAGPISGSSVIVQRGAARVSFFGLVVGTTPRIVGEAGGDQDNTTPNYAVRQRACAAAYPATAEGLPAAHVCSSQEAMAHALQAPDTVPDSASGGIVHTYGYSWFGPLNSDGAEQIVSDAGAMVGRVGTTVSSLRLHRRDSDGAWTLRIENGAAVDEPLVCCQ